MCKQLPHSKFLISALFLRQFCYVAQDGFELAAFFCFYLLSAGTLGMCHHAWLFIFIFLPFETQTHVTQADFKPAM